MSSIHPLNDQDCYYHYSPENSNSRKKFANQDCPVGSTKNLNDILDSLDKSLERKNEEGGESGQSTTEDERNNKGAHSHREDGKSNTKAGGPKGIFHFEELKRA